MVPARLCYLSTCSRYLSRVLEQFFYLLPQVEKQSNKNPLATKRDSNAGNTKQLEEKVAELQRQLQEGEGGEQTDLLICI